MKKETIRASYHDRRQREKFEPVEFGCEITARLDEGDEVVDCYHELATDAKIAVGTEMTRRLKESAMAEDVDRDD